MLPGGVWRQKWVRCRDPKLFAIHAAWRNRASSAPSLIVHTKPNRMLMFGDPHHRLCPPLSTLYRDRCKNSAIMLHRQLRPYNLRDFE